MIKSGHCQTPPSPDRHATLVLDFFIFIYNGGCTCKKKDALSLKRHLFPHGDRVKFWPWASWIYFSIKRHLLERHLTLSEKRPNYSTDFLALGLGLVFHLPTFVWHAPPICITNMFFCRSTVISKSITDRHFSWGEFILFKDIESCCQKS